MKITASTAALQDVQADLLVAVFDENSVAAAPQFQQLDRLFGGALKRYVDDVEFVGKQGQMLRVPAGGKLKADWLALVGAGKPRGTAERARSLGVRASRALGAGQQHVAILLGAADADTVRFVSEGLVLGSYRYTKYLTSNKPKKRSARATLVLAPNSSTDSRSAIERGVVVGEAVNLARDLVNAPPNDLNPVELAQIAKDECDKHGVECQVWNKKRIEKERMNLFLAVNRGSGIEPRFVHMRYVPKRAAAKTKKIVFVGKGLTFDAGGLCIKPAKSMITMKCDMAGAAVTLATVLVAARLKLPVEVHGVIGATENMTGEHAYRPGDVFPSLQGKTVEIINTDAEGRLVLADVLAWAARLEPDFLVDHATLTGACMVALGPYRAGLFSNDEGLARSYEDASKGAGEPFWTLPLDPELRSSLKSDIADLKHTGGSYGGAISAALFLQEFVGDARWVHLDIAGPAFLEHAHDPHPQGGSGFGVSTAVRFLESLA